MELYWFYVDPLYPFLDRTRWNRAYDAIFAGTAMDLDERIFMATLNVILALSTQLLESQSLDQREQSSETFFRRAQELLPMNPWEPGSLELVQCLLVTSQYLQSTYNPHQTWMVIGSAIRMAQGLGLHLPETSSSRSDLGERELLRRIWYGCVLMDRMVSVTHGRPAMISQHLAKSVPLPTESTTNEPCKIQNPEYYSFFVRHIQDSRSKEKETYSDPESSDGEDDDLDRVVQLDRCISRWESRLPNHLRWDLLESNTDKIAQRQAVILRMRFLHARILLLRPVLSRFCLSPFPSKRPQAEDNLQTRVIQQSAMFCVATAQNMINTLVAHQSMDRTVGLLPAWWYRVYYVYSAATVLIAAKLRPDIFSAAGIGQSWGQAISLLKTHEQFGQSAKRCVTALHILSSKILQATSRGSLGREVVNNNGIPNPDTRDDQISPHMVPDIESIDRIQQMVQGFESPVPDFNPQDFVDFDFNVNDMSWLNNIQGVWELLNE
ncbi:fungal-specific transcription factor domain-containing protein [Fusarium venenatum]|uniref:fungal-specific transcription factor domain-containing protein n=1 Tax=Fusarium venenatum TaxID=56646 RepID=UPI001D5DDE89|nr:fungal-specific transcription factor domain-containing protein [Fusarium venenatum]